MLLLSLLTTTNQIYLAVRVCSEWVNYVIKVWQTNWLMLGGWWCSRTWQSTQQNGPSSSSGSDTLFLGFSVHCHPSTFSSHLPPFSSPSLAHTLHFLFPLASYSVTGKKLLAKCRSLIQENQELGKQISQGRVAQLEAEIALQKKLNQEVKGALDGMCMH